MPTTTRIHAVSVYRSIPRSTERYMEERLWQRALQRLEGPKQKPAPARKKKARQTKSFAAILRAIRNGLGRHVDMYV
ncbi:hypothetical protein [Ferrovibrio sp.]|uniref:hypothetical protein n=1 Tax=Ferrovibrio sp. TaxID=1917215 RepID=UPI0035B08CB5